MKTHVCVIYLVRRGLITYIRTETSRCDSRRIRTPVLKTRERQGSCESRTTLVLVYIDRPKTAYSTSSPLHHRDHMTTEKGLIKTSAFLILHNSSGLFVLGRRRVSRDSSALKGTPNDR